MQHYLDESNLCSWLSHGGENVLTVYQKISRGPWEPRDSWEDCLTRLDGNLDTCEDGTV